MNTQASDFRILDPGAMSAMASNFRQELLMALVQPNSAAGLARQFDMSRQRIGYHMRELEKAGCIELASERQARGLVEKLYRVRPIAYVFAPDADAGERASADRFSWASLLNMIANALWDLVRLRRGADTAGKRLATLAIEAELRFPNPRARKAFTEELVAAIELVVRKHHQANAPQGRNFRLVLGAYPSPTSHRQRSGKES
jgi:DNA-binding transcriptional ArsR family regulator